MTPRQIPYAGMIAALMIAAAGEAAAQDSRNVSEPSLPPSCAVLSALSPAVADEAPRIQMAIDHCAAGHAVRLSAGAGRADYHAGPLNLRSGVSLLIDDGVTLYASTNPYLYRRGDARCGTVDATGHGCRPFITADQTKGSGIYGGGVIDGQGGHVVDRGNESWWQLARRAQKEDARQNVPRLIEINGGGDFTLYRVTLRNSPNFHVTLNQVDGVTAWGVRIDTPATARNTDGIDPISSRNITIAHSAIRTGDDNVAIKAGQNGASENISILHNSFYSGHGMSIGSETNGGLRHVLVDDLSMDGTTSGLRIKSDISRGGAVDGVRYHDVCMRDVAAPIDISASYNPRADGNLMPVYSNLVFDRVASVTPGRVIVQGYDDQHPVRAALHQVIVAGAAQRQIRNAALSGDMLASDGADALCAGHFAPFPLTQPAAVRPQLTIEQAKRYSYDEVLKYVGAAGHETIDPWDPLKDPLATGAVFQADYTVDLTARADGVKLFNSVQAAVSRAIADSTARPLDHGRRYILVRPGVYHELLYVPAAAVPITLYGDGADAASTKISANIDAAVTAADYQSRFGPQFAAADPAVRAMYDTLKDRSPIQTSAAMVVWVRNDGFQARNLTFENAYNKDTGDALAECAADVCAANGIEAQMNKVHHQAVALQVDGADKVQFENVRLIGFQDTLFLKSPRVASTVRSFFNRSYIEGDVDYIFGDSTAYFFETEIKTLGDRSTSYMAAPDTNRATRYGFVFDHCRFTHDGSANARKGQFYLARQWFHNQRCTPYGTVALAGYACTLGAVDRFAPPTGTITKATLETVGKVAILNSRIGAHINRDHPWSNWNKDGTLPYRPVQFNSDDYWRNLSAAHIDPVADMGYEARPASPDIYLAEFNNADE